MFLKMLHGILHPGAYKMVQKEGPQNSRLADWRLKRDASVNL